MPGREINAEVVQEREELALAQYMLGEKHYEGCSFCIGFFTYLAIFENRNPRRLFLTSAISDDSKRAARWHSPSYSLL
jgi:hypothetical protein